MAAEGVEEGEEAFIAVAAILGAGALISAATARVAVADMATVREVKRPKNCIMKKMAIISEKVCSGKFC